MVEKRTSPRALRFTAWNKPLMVSMNPLVWRVCSQATMHVANNMPTILTHAAVPLALGIGLGERIVQRRLLAAGVAASMLPDLDVLAFRFNIAYTDNFGHRGASHSIALAILVALVAMMFAQRLQSSRLKTFLFIGVVCASHGVLDTFTNGGNGVALLWPFSGQRIFAPWQAIEVSPLSLSRVFSGRGLEVLESEFVLVWLPAIAVCGALILFRRLKPNSDANNWERP